MLNVSTILAFLLAVLLAFANSYLYDWGTGDERWHYNYSKRMFDTGEIERETVHNFNSTTPLVLINVFLDETLIKLGITQEFDKVIVRLPAVGWYILLLLLSAIAARYLFSELGAEQAALIACWAMFLTCLDQILLGQASQIGSDIPFAVMTLLFLLSLESYRRLPNFKAALILGLVLGLSFNVKYSTTFLLLFALLAMPVIYFKLNSFSWRNIGRLLAQLFGLLLVLSFIIDAAYGFKDVGLSFSSKEWYSAPFQFLARSIPNLPLPWPLPFIAGFDHQFAAERTWSWNSILLGREFPNGVWYYFPLIWALKTPLVLIAVSVLGGALALGRTRELCKNRAFLLCFLLSAFFLGYFCFVFRTQVGIRYILMCLPLSYVLLAYILSTGLVASEQRLLALVLLLGTAYEGFPYLGNNLSFTNGILADKSQAYTWIADSNIDWFHNYTRANAEAAKKLGKSVLNPPHILEGDNLFTLNKLAGVMRNFPQYAWVRKHLSPKGHFGHTLVWYNVDTKTFERFLDEERTYSSPSGTANICPPDRVYQPLQNGSSIEFNGTWDEPGLYSACLKVTEPSKIELKVLRGYGIAGSYPSELNCVGNEAGQGESLWFKLAPGIHPICARVMDKTQAHWIIHQGKVQLALRNQS